MDPTLKQRLVGTAVLVALAVIFVPMILDGPVEPVDDRRITGVPLQLPEPLPEPRGSDPSRGSDPMVANPAGTDADSSPRGSDPMVANPAGTSTAPPAAATGFAVQLGAFRDESAAEALVARLRSQGFDAFVMSGDGWHRVRVGPLAERDAAVTLAERVHRAIGEPTQVVTHP